EKVNNKVKICKQLFLIAKRQRLRLLILKATRNLLNTVIIVVTFLTTHTSA
ncbi:hypothetical protein QE152_g23516, partial [Popillia japonica]